MKVRAWLEAEKLATLENMAAHGMTDTDIAECLGITRMTLWRWRERYPQIAEAIGRGRMEQGHVIENALFRQAVGRTDVTVTTEELEDGTTITRRTTRTVPPDTRAAIFYLTRRVPKSMRATRGPIFKKS